MKISFVVLMAAASVTLTSAAGAETTACATLSEAEATKLVGGTLGAVSKTERKPTDENGGDHQTGCGYFPKGYDIEKAEGPPERGILVTLHTMRDADAAKRYYEGVLGMLSGNPEAGERPVPVSGLGEKAYLKRIKLPGSTSKIATMTFLSGNVMADVQVWMSVGTVDGILNSAARQVLTKLR